MLILNTVVPESSFSRSINEYVPLKIEFEPTISSIDDLYYWRSTNDQYLLELKIAAATGALAEITLVLVPNNWILRRKSIRDICDVKIKKRGHPVFKLHLWKDKIGLKEIGIDPALRQHDEHHTFKFFIASDGVAVMFDEFVPHSSVVNNGISFCLNDRNEFCGLIVENIENSEMELLNSFY